MKKLLSNSIADLLQGFKNEFGEEVAPVGKRIGVYILCVIAFFVFAYCFLYTYFKDDGAIGFAIFGYIFVVADIISFIIVCLNIKEFVYKKIIHKE